MADDADLASFGQDVYQLRMVLAGISPLIWRRLLVSGATTIAGLHAIVQTVFGWGGEHLHRFCIHGARKESRCSFGVRRSLIWYGDFERGS